jgi:hypothetical protein
MRTIHRFLTLFAVVVATALSARAAALRPPAVPLVAHDPYFSIWSAADRLTDVWPSHWTGKRNAMQSMVRVDGKTFRLMGPEPKEVPALTQTSLEVLPTRTIYSFANSQIHVSLTFTTPALPDDLDILARPVTYLTWQAASLDGQPHEVSLYYECAAEIAVDEPSQPVVWSRETVSGLDVLKTGSKEQPVLRKRGDDRRIDWGYAYVASPTEFQAQSAMGAGASLRNTFASGQALPAADDKRQPRAASDQAPVLAFTFVLGTVKSEPVSRHLLLAYDDEFSMNYMGQKLRPYWRRHGMDAAGLLKAAARDYAQLRARCARFDEELMTDLLKTGGDNYVKICCLAYRQFLAGNKLTADANGQPLMFPKENFSNGCVGTVDVIYPMAPFCFLFSSGLSKAILAPVLDYGMSSRWKFPFAPHDLGQYPHATGQVYGGGERTEENQMPVEESGNMLILVGALAQMEGNANYAAKYWPALTRWAEYLKSKGFDPENQLCTDDFAGHLAHNVNLSGKAIVALGVYARLCDMLGKKAEAKSYRQAVEEFAIQWAKLAAEQDHYRLAYDQPGSWSQKYNLVWDRILGLNIFPAEVFRKEMDFYKKNQKTYGLPLDNRKDYTKLDWITWTATLTGSREDFEALTAPIVRFLNETPSRVPMTDWYWTTTAKLEGFVARPVVGGVFIKMLDDSSMWKKWARKGDKAAGKWAPFPEPVKVKILAPTAQTSSSSWRFTFDKPADDWQAAAFDATAWKEGPGGFGTASTPNTTVMTEWKGSDIWLRREIELPAGKLKGLMLRMFHDEDAEVYINGTIAVAASGFNSQYEDFEIAAEAKAALKPGKNILAVHCHQTTGGQYIDLGLVAE